MDKTFRTGQRVLIDDEVEGVIETQALTRQGTIYGVRVDDEVVEAKVRQLTKVDTSAHIPKSEKANAKIPVLEMGKPVKAEDLEVVEQDEEAILEASTEEGEASRPDGFETIDDAVDAEVEVTE